MKLNIYQIDAFTDSIFSGNPAAVIPLEQWLSDEILQNIATENNLSETAFFVKEKQGFHIRWFTPLSEVNLCGHATLATAHVLFVHLGFEGSVLEFQSRSGLLKVEKTEDNILTLNFPAAKLSKMNLPDHIKAAIGIEPVECWHGDEDIMLIFESEKQTLSITPDFEKLKDPVYRGVIVTAPGDTVDFVSRFFAPAYGINEDPVTGSAHTLLIPYWSKKLGKTKMKAKQISKRGGDLICSVEGDRVNIGGDAVTYMEGSIVI